MKALATLTGYVKEIRTRMVSDRRMLATVSIVTTDPEKPIELAIPEHAANALARECLVAGAAGGQVKITIEWEPAS